MSKESATKSSMDSSVRTGYMTEDQLADYLTRMDGNVSKPEVEYMYLSRRRQSLDMVRNDVFCVDELDTGRVSLNCCCFFFRCTEDKFGSYDWSHSTCSNYDAISE